MDTLILVLALILLAVYGFYVSTKHPENFPPGPRFPLPFIGDGLAVGGNNVQGFTRLRKR